LDRACPVIDVAIPTRAVAISEGTKPVLEALVDSAYVLAQLSVRCVDTERCRRGNGEATRVDE
jgi:hypothetical protein